MFDLVIVGAGVVGMSATFYALQKGWNICVIEHQKIGDQ
jgi:glycine/D-amino acid oxidase-like deaminating enzyme